MILIEKLEKVFILNNEFIESIKEESLKLHINSIRSNSIGSQIACLLGARDAYGKCILNDETFSWNPDFLHSDRYTHVIVKKHAQEVSSSLISKFKEIDILSENQSSLLLDLISHEYLHQGQLIRYIYANNLEIPTKLKGFWHLED